MLFVNVDLLRSGGFVLAGTARAGDVKRLGLLRASLLSPPVFGEGVGFFERRKHWRW